MHSDARAFYQRVNRRRTVPSFTPDPVPRDIIEQCLLAAGTAPSGAHQQPWHLVVVEDPAVKRRIRDGAEAEERACYGGHAPGEWLAALAPLGTDEHKPFPGDRPVPDRDLRAGVCDRSELHPAQALLRPGIGRHCHRAKDVVVLGAVAPDAETHGSQRIEDATVTVIDLDNVRAAGVKPTATRAVDRLSRPGLAAFWIHLDADVLADAIMPAVDYRMPDGLSWEAIAEVLRRRRVWPRSRGRRHDLQSNARWRRVDRAGVGKHARQGARA